MSHWAATGQFQGKRGEPHRLLAAAAQLLQSARFNMTSPPPDWQLPVGVSRGLWQYVHDDAIARNYDANLGDSALVTIDCHFVQKHCPKPGRFIDLGCGTGRLAIAMARCGHWTLGVDLSAPMLHVARDKATAAGVLVECVQANLVELGGLDDASFDYAACLFSTLGMISGAAERRRMLTHVHRLLRPGGVLVLHVHNRWFNFWNPQGREWLLRDIMRSLTGRAGAGNRHMPPYGDMPPLTLHLFTRREVLQLLRGAGFSIREVRPVSLMVDGKLAWPCWFGWLRAYGYLIAAEKRE
jgi:ubiquinone/menaquinone biosynthesis C-methylase UbiE